LAATSDAASMLGPASQLLSAIARPAQLDQAAAQQASYTVKSGDTLSKIAATEYKDQSAWPVLYYANRSEIHWANVIQPGQVLKVPAKPGKIPAAPGQLGPQVSVASVASTSTRTSTSTVPSARTSSRSVSSSSSYSGGTPGGSFGACVVERESGGNAQVMNSSGHYGLYQFSESTWEAYGGSASSFGNASVSEQNRVFSNALAAGGQSNWSPYDGC
jgi:LysM repeat protein